MYQKYFISTGDYIRGITFDTSTTNAVINAFGVMYFLFRKKMGMVLLCMTVLLLTCSNFTNLLTVLCLVYIFLFRSGRNEKSLIIVCISLLVVFMTNVSPSNNKYSLNIFKRNVLNELTEKKNDVFVPIAMRPDSVLSSEEKKMKMARLYLDSIAAINASGTVLQMAQQINTKKNPVIHVPKVNIHAPEYQHRQDSSEARLQALRFLNQLRNNDSLPLHGPSDARNLSTGKIIAYRELFTFLQQHPGKIPTGNGIGNFSSKLAFRATGLKIAGGYPASYTYIGNDFKNNHLTVYLDYFGKDSGYHSLIHSPNSFYAQLLGEYGIAGVVCFLLFYLGYFIRSYKKLTYGVPVLLVMMGALFVDYWFEQLSVIILFELLLLLDVKTSGEGLNKK